MDMKSNITNLINEHKVCLFMKGSPDAPQCGFSMTVSNILKHLNVHWPTIPQLYINGEFIGGCDIVKELFDSGELKKILQEKKII